MTYLSSLANDIVVCDEWLDENVSFQYKEQPLAQDWARIAKVIEELGECLAEFILVTGQNPRKGIFPNHREDMLNEMADVCCTGMLGIQHFTKDIDQTLDIITQRMARIRERISP